MSDLTKDTLPTPEARRPLVPVEVWGGTLYVSVLSAEQGASLPGVEDLEHLFEDLLIKSVVYADRTPVWTDASQAMAYPRGDLKPLITAALEVNHFTQAKAEEDKEK